MKFESFEEQKLWRNVYIAFATADANRVFSPRITAGERQAFVDEPMVQADLAVTRYRARVGNPEPATGRQQPEVHA